MKSTALRSFGNLAICLLGVFLALFAKNFQPNTKNRINTQAAPMLLLPTLDMWQKHGLAYYHFSPINSYDQPGDAFVTVYPRLMDQKGQNYYVSYPPFGFIVTHYVLKVLHAQPNFRNLQLLGFFSFCFAAILIFLIAHQLQGLPLYRFSWLSVLTVSIYVFANSLVHLHLNVLFPEMWVHIPWLILIYLLIKQTIKSNVQFFLIFVFAFLTAGTEWLGTFAVGLLSIYFLIFKRDYKMALCLSVALMLAIGLFIWAYASIDGFDSMIHALRDRAVKRSGLFATEMSEEGVGIHNQNVIGSFFKIYFTSMGWWNVLTFIIATFAVLLSRKNKFYGLLLFGVLLPVWMYNIIFLNSSLMHFHVFSKNIVFIAFFTLMSFIYFKDKGVGCKTIPVLSVLLIIFMFSADYFSKEKFLIHEVDDEKMKSLAHELSKKITPETAVYMKSEIPDISFAQSPLGYLMKRQIGVAADVDDAKKQETGRNRQFVFIRVNNDYKIEDYFTSDTVSLNK